MGARKKIARRPQRRQRRKAPASPLLKTYNTKRRFDLTSEPRGGAVFKQRGHAFVIQQHDATRMHFDFRLELDGVLKSWAVPKGPSLSPQEKRLAVQTEDHPLSYRRFEGYIPEGQYGGGPVIVWDEGRWTPLADPHKGLAKGHLDFKIKGKKIQGRFNLVRLKDKAPGPKSNWLLIKRTDEHVREGTEAEPAQHLTESVISGRTVQEVGAGVESEAPKPRAPSRRSQKADARPLLKGIDCQLATLVDRPPSDSGWIWEVKFDGYRMLASTGKKVELYSRNHLNWTSKFPVIAKALKTLEGDAVLDCELCFVTEEGKTDFQQLQNAIGRGTGEPLDHSKLVLYVFDLLWIDGEDLRERPLTERKARLEKYLAQVHKQPIQYSAHLQGDSRPLFAQSCTLGLEGLIGKRPDKPYSGRRGTDWIKLKCQKRQEFVIVGYLESTARSGFKSLLLATRDGDKLTYNSKVGTGFNAESIRQISKQLKPLITDKPQFEGAPRFKNAVWLKPKLVCEVQFSEMTRDGSLRNPSFQGMRLDKPAREVQRERALPVRKASRKRSGEAETVAGRSITHPDRVVDETSGITKLQLAEYHARVADRLLAYAADRPLALVRCPQGNAAQCFFQKNPMAGTDKDVRNLDIDGKDALAVKSPAGVLELVQFNAIEFHGWGCRMPASDKPDWMIFDLDPDEGLGFGAVVDAAVEVRDILKQLGLESSVKTTGGKGLHVVVPLQPKANWEEVHGFTHQIAQTLEAMAPDRYVATMSKAKRKGRIFVDYLRNGKGSTAVLPFSPRARPGMPVAVPMDWKQLRKLNPKDYRVDNADSWLKAFKDPWSHLWARAKPLPSLETLISKARR